MGCLASVSKCFLILFNLIWLLLGIVFLGCGIAVAVAGAQFIDQALASLPAGVTPTAISGFDITTFLQSAYIPLIVIGAVFFIFGFLGCCGACCSSSVLLLCYAILVGLVLAAQVGGVIYVVIKKNDIDQQSRSEVEKVIYDNFVGFNSTDLVSLLTNFAQVQFQCCGVEAANGFTRATKWQKTITYSGSTVTLQYPLTCCKMTSTQMPYTLEDDNCPQSPTTTNSWIQTPCWDRLTAFVESQVTWVIITLCIIFGIQLLFIIMACILRRHIEMDKRVGVV